MVKAHAQGSRGPVHNPLRMLSPESLRHMAAPAHWPVCLQCVLQFLGWDLVPLDCFVLAVQQGWRVIVPVDLAEGFVAILAFCVLIPVIDDGPY